MGGSSKTETKESHTTTAPWHAQQPFLTTAWHLAQGDYWNNRARGAYKGSLTAAPNQDQYDANDAAIDFAKNLGNTSVDNMLSGASGTAADGQGATRSAIGGFGDFLGSDSLGNTITGANRVLQGFDIPGAVQAAMGDANREVANSILPSLYRGAAGAGNINSDRTAIAEGVVKEGLARKAADISANLRNSLFQTGIDTSQADTASRLGALGQLGSIGGQATSTGYDTIGTGVDTASKVLSLGSAGAEGNQQLAQSLIDKDVTDYYAPQRYNDDLLRNFYNIIGSNNWGSEQDGTEKTTTKNNPSTLSTIGSGLGAVGGLLKK